MKNQHKPVKELHELRPSNRNVNAVLALGFAMPYLWAFGLTWKTAIALLVALYFVVTD